MTKHAIVRDDTAKVLLVAPIIAWAHRPGSAIFGIPGHWQLNELPFGRTAQVRLGVIARAENIVELLFEEVGFFSFEACLITLQEELPVALWEIVMPVRRRVVEAIRKLAGLGLRSLGARKRTAHPSKRI